MVIRNLSKFTSLKGAAAVADQGIVSATNFLASVIIGRFCSKEEFGLYSLGLTIIFFVMCLQTSLISSPYIIYNHKLKSNVLQNYTGSSFVHYVLNSILITIILVLIATILSFGKKLNDLSEIIWVLVVVLSFILLREYTRRLFFAWFMMSTALLLDFCIGISQIGLLYSLKISSILSAKFAFFVNGIVCGVFSFVILLKWRRRFRFRLKYVSSDFHRNWSIGKWILAGNIVFLASNQLYPWFLVNFHGASATGTFAACLGITTILNPILLGAGNYLGPKTAYSFTKGIRELRRVINKATLIIAIFTIFFCIALFIFGEQLLVFIFGNKYAGNKTIVWVLSISISAVAMATPVSYGLWAIERPDINAKVNLVCLGLTMTLGFWLVQLYGAIGAAYGLLINNLVLLLIKIVVFFIFLGSLMKPLR
jgi:O-antigen/teichoic acid export membrane protein